MTKHGPHRQGPEVKGLARAGMAFAIEGAVVEKQ
jgi:hypothetical protein